MSDGRHSYREVSRQPAWGLFDGNQLMGSVRATSKSEAAGIFIDSDYFDDELIDRLQEQVKSGSLSRASAIRVEKL